MRIIRVEARNFACYQEVAFEFTEAGLTLISGPTGAGKSTLFDLVCWILFGVTAKDGAVDDIKSWNGGDTRSRILLHLDPHTAVEITRERGAVNDLYYNLYDPTVYQDSTNIIPNPRGKDLKDTQKLINDILGFTPDLYLSGAYFHEFSQTAQFFSTTAKGRRETINQVCDLALSARLRDGVTKTTKNTKNLMIDDEKEEMRLKEHVEWAEKQKTDLQYRSLSWTKSHENTISSARREATNFEMNKAMAVFDLEEKSKIFQKQHYQETKLAEEEVKLIQAKIYPEDYYDPIIGDLAELAANCAEEVCPTCGSPKEAVKKMALIEELHSMRAAKAENDRLIQDAKKAKRKYNEVLKAINPYLDQVNREKSRTNVYTQQLKKLESAANPYEAQLGDLLNGIEVVKKNLAAVESKLTDHRVKLADLELLDRANDEFRNVLVKSTVIELQENTNRILSKHFDSEFRVAFLLEDDKLDVSITKDGNKAAFTQLSKGQRQMLKLCFGVSVMRSISNHHGINFNCLFFDEALSGLDDDMKQKAFGIFQDLATSHESIFVVDHSESLKLLFSKRYNVEMHNGVSTIAEA